MDGAKTSAVHKPFIEHLHELRIRLALSGLVVAMGGAAAFAVHQQLLNIIQKPLHETLYFTSPVGGLSFIFQLCVTAGIIIGFPFIVYQAYKFLSPVMRRQKRSLILGYISTSFLMACFGVVFAYFISLPAALHFLTQFGGEGIKSLIKADEYFSFALAYLGGFAVLFQIPLIVLFINRITPLKPGSMMRAQRWIILGSFIVAAILTPTPDPINQTLMAAPAIVLYQMSILLVMFVNRKRSVKAKPAVSVQLSEPESLPESAPAFQNSFVEIKHIPVMWAEETEVAAATSTKGSKANKAKSSKSSVVETKPKAVRRRQTVRRRRRRPLMTMPDYQSMDGIFVLSR